MQRVAALRANRPTPWVAAAWKPKGPGGYAPISSRPVSSVAPTTHFAGPLDLEPNPPRQNGAIKHEQALKDLCSGNGVAITFASNGPCPRG